MKFSLFSAALFAALSSSSAMTVEECEQDFLPDRVACYDTDGPCVNLPIPEDAFPRQELNSNGYYLEHLRNTEHSHVFAITENSYWGLIVIDIASPEAQNQRKMTASSNKMTMPNGLRAGRKLGKKQHTTHGQEEGGHVNTNENTVNTIEMGADPVEGKPLSIAIIDFPEAFFQVADNGRIEGYLPLTAVEDIIEGLDMKIEDIGHVDMIYSHAHFDHVGGANFTYNALQQGWGLDKSMIAVVASEGVRDKWETAITRGLFSYRAPLPDKLVVEDVVYTVGQNTELHLMPAFGHQTDDIDMIIAMEGIGTEQPPILMMVDVVFPGWAPFFSFAITKDMGAYLDIHAYILGMGLPEDTVVVAGHLTNLGTLYDVELNLNFTSDVLKAAGEALSSIDPASVPAAATVWDPSSPNFGNTYEFFKIYLGEVDKRCAQTITSQYGCHLAAVDTAATSHCAVASEYLRVDV